MNFADNNINLNRYQCAQCRRTPEKAQELFQGCICGHRLFRILHQTSKIQSTANKAGDITPNKNTEEIGFLTVQELEVGIYNINVKKLLDDKSNKKHSSPVVVGNKGVFSIHLQNQKK